MVCIWMQFFGHGRLISYIQNLWVLMLHADIRHCLNITFAINIDIEYDIEYDVAIIGAGMIGSAAAKYASEDVETSILIGPDQPQDGIHSGIQK